MPIVGITIIAPAAVCVLPKNPMTVANAAQLICKIPILILQVRCVLPVIAPMATAATKLVIILFVHPLLLGNIVPAVMLKEHAKE